MEINLSLQYEKIQISFICEKQISLYIAHLQSPCLTHYE